MSLVLMGKSGGTRYNIPVGASSNPVITTMVKVNVILRHFIDRVWQICKISGNMLSQKI